MIVIDFLVAYWVFMVGAIGVVTLVFCVAKWRELSCARRISAVFVVALALHMIEEYWLPGGFHYVFNVAQGSLDGNAYPLNTVSAMVTNLTAEVIFAVIMSKGVEKPWIELLIAFFGIAQTIIHVAFGVVAFGMFQDAGMMFPYSPGMADSVVLMLPLSVCCIVHVRASRPLGKNQVLLAVLAAAFLIVGLIRVPVMVLGSDPATAFVFADAGFYQQFLG